MKKSLIALAVISAFSAQAAMADTTVYGAANVSFDSINNGGAGKTVPGTLNGARANAVSSNASNIGFKGAEDLGDGLSAVWQIEEAVNFVSNGTGTVSATGATNAANTTGTNFTSRNTFAGLSSTTVGTAIIGIHDTPYKMATRGMDVFADTIADNRSIMGSYYGDLRLNNVAAYISPAMGGVTLAVATITGAELAGNNANSVNNAKGSALSAAALYGAGPLNASLAYQTVKVGAAGTGTLGLAGGPIAAGDKINNWKLGAGYTMDAFAVNAVYEKSSSSGLIGNMFERSAWYLSGKYSMTASDALKAAYTNAGNTNSVANTGVKQYSLGYDHSLSKHTAVYALYTKLSNDSAANYGLGNSDANSSVSSAAGSLNSAPSSFSLGMKHSF